MFNVIGSRIALKRARAAARAEDWAATTKYYRRVLKFRPHAGVLWIQYAHALKEEGDAEQAEAAYRRAILKMPDIEFGYRELAYFLRRQNRKAEAQILAAAGLVVAPNSEHLLRELNELGIYGVDVDERLKLGALVVRSMRRRAATVNGGHLALARARSAARKKLWSKAADRYATYLAQQPDDGLARIQYAHMLDRAGEAERAMKAYRQTVSRDPLLADAHLELGHALMRYDNSEQALQAFLMAIKLDPSLGQARHALNGLGIIGQQIDNLVRIAWIEPMQAFAVRDEVRSGDDGQHPNSPGFRPSEAPRHIQGRERQLWTSLAHQLSL